MEIKAKKGYVFAKADKSAVYDNVLYLGIHDSEDNYIQITKKEAEAIKAELESKLEANNETVSDNSTVL